MFGIANRFAGAAILPLTPGSCLALAQTVSPNPGSSSMNPWHSDSAVYVAGVDDLKQKRVGSLKIMADDLVFSTRDAEKRIPLRQITAVYIGDERVAYGGTPAKVARKIPLFGLGAAAAGAVTSKKVDVLTIEYEDVRSGYHGAVFEVPKSQAEIARQRLTPFAPLPHREITAANCNGAAQPKTLLVAAIDERGVQLPAQG